MANVASNINSDEKQKLVAIFVLGMDACTNVRNENPSSHWFLNYLCICYIHQRWSKTLKIVWKDGIDDIPILTTGCPNKMSKESCALMPRAS